MPIRIRLLSPWLLLVLLVPTLCCAVLSFDRDYSVNYVLDDDDEYTCCDGPAIPQQYTSFLPYLKPGRPAVSLYRVNDFIIPFSNGPPLL
jgi:hypothetical protein